MFLPVGDDNRDRTTTPYVNYLFIAVNVLVFVLLQKMRGDGAFTFAYATVPAEILTGTDFVTNAKRIWDPVLGQSVTVPGLAPTPIPVHLTLLTAMFMHGGWAHLGGNMLFLWVFGDNIEDSMGHRKYFFFYLVCGVLAGLAHVFSSAYLGQSVYIPSLGASGAVSGVLGGYILLHPRRSVHLWILLGIFSVPAWLAVGLWFVFQVINGAGLLGGEESAGGVAYAAHIGGFIAGLLLVKAFANSRRLRLIEKEEFSR